MCFLTRDRLLSCTCGGISRRASFRHWFFLECRFKSCHVSYDLIESFLVQSFVNLSSRGELSPSQQRSLPILKAVEEGDLECVSCVYKNARADKQVAKVGNVLPSWKLKTT